MRKWKCHFCLKWSWKWQIPNVISPLQLPHSAMVGQPDHYQLREKRRPTVRSLWTLHVCPDATEKSLQMVSQPDHQLREQPRPTVRSLCTFHVCGTSLCALMRQKVLRVRQYVHIFGPVAVFYNVLLPVSLNSVQNVRFMPCQLFGYINMTHTLDIVSKQKKGMTFWVSCEHCPKIRQFRQQKVICVQQKVWALGRKLRNADFDSTHHLKPGRVSKSHWEKWEWKS